MRRLALLFAPLVLTLGAQQLHPSPRPSPHPLPLPARAAAALLPDYNPLQAMKEREVGDFYRKRQDYVGALARYHVAQRLDPSNAETYFDLGETELKMDARPQARLDFEHYLALVPTGPHASAVHKVLAKLARNIPHPASGTQKARAASGVSR